MRRGEATCGEEKGSRARGGGGRAAGGGGSPPKRKAGEEREWTVVWRRDMDRAKDGGETRETVREKIRFCFIYFAPCYF
jgi:hypothetical protein